MLPVSLGGISGPKQRGSLCDVLDLLVLFSQQDYIGTVSLTRTEVYFLGFCESATVGLKQLLGFNNKLLYLIAVVKITSSISFFRLQYGTMFFFTLSCVILNSSFFHSSFSELNLLLSEMFSIFCGLSLKLYISQLKILLSTNTKL